jgi:intracellular multiplication protein IcmS
MSDKAANREIAAVFVAQMIAVAKTLKCSFSLRKEPISLERAFAPDGLLPAIMRRADQIASFCLGYSLGISFERADASILGVTVEFNSKVTTGVRLLCALDVLMEFIGQYSHENVTALDELLTD